MIRTSHEAFVTMFVRHAEAALDCAAIGSRRVSPIPIDAICAELSFLAANRIRIDLLAQCKRVHAKFFRQLIDRLLERKCARCVARSAHRRTRAGIDKNVGLLDREVVTGVELLCDEPGARTHADARRAVGIERNGC
jgi:hypothetical protein